MSRRPFVTIRILVIPLILPSPLRAQQKPFFRHNVLPFFVPHKAYYQARQLAGFSFDDGPTVNSQDELAAATTIKSTACADRFTLCYNVKQWRKRHFQARTRL